MTSIMDNFEGHLGAFVAEEGIYSLEHLMRKAGFGAALSPEPSDTDSAEDGGFDRIASPQSKADRRAAKRRETMALRHAQRAAERAAEAQHALESQSAA